MTKIELIGSHVTHSASPEMMNAGLEALGRPDISYKVHPLVPAADKDGTQIVLERYLEGARDRGVGIVAVTMPFKQNVSSCRNVLTQDSMALVTGTVNILRDDDTVWQAHNTDKYGILQALRNKDVSLTDGRVVIFGDGATAITATEAVGSLKAREVVLVGRNPQQREHILQRIMGRNPGLTVEHCSFPEFNDYSSQSFTLAINATPVGQFGTSGYGNNIATGLQVNAETRFDVVYSPLVTPFLASGRRMGAIAISGLDMLVYQGINQLRFATGHSPEGMFQQHLVEVMTAAATEKIQRTIG